MRICHITEYCPAGTVGGTERYIQELIGCLGGLGHESVIGWLSIGAGQSLSNLGRLRIHRLPGAEMRVDSPPPELARAAERLFEAERPEVLHFHTFGQAEAMIARLGRERGIPYAFTYHSPAWTCRRETMLLHGTKPCDGAVRPWRCSVCQSEERLGLGRAMGQVAAACSAGLGWAALPLGRRSFRRRTAFFYDNWYFRTALRRFLSHCGLVVSCAEWSAAVLVANGARPEAVVSSPQGVSEEYLSIAADYTTESPAQNADAFTVGYVGRTVAVKGVDILMEGFLRTTEPSASLRIVGWEPENAHMPYARKLQALAKVDSRIFLVPKTNLSGTIEEYRRLSLLAIPSATLETGPLTLLEALAVGVPVFGSNRLGQLNLLKEKGRVVEPNTADGWAKALEEAFRLHKSGRWGGQAARARCNGELRTMKHVAEEMAGHYRRLAALS